MNYEELCKANELIKTTDVKGKDYAEVNQRIKAFRSVYPEGFIKTSIMQDTEGKCVIYAECGYYADDGSSRVIGTGTAYEKEGSTYINKTSYIENCETSAVGRALGMCGFGIDTSIASAEEVQNAIANQEQPKSKVFVETPKKLAFKEWIKNDELYADAISTNVIWENEAMSVGEFLRSHKKDVDKLLEEFPEFADKITYIKLKSEEWKKL